MRPVRSPSGHRMYHRKNVIQFLHIKHLLHEQGYTISGARKAMKEDSGPSAMPVVQRVSPDNGDSSHVGLLSDALSDVSRSREILSGLLKQLS